MKKRNNKKYFKKTYTRYIKIEQVEVICYIIKVKIIRHNIKKDLIEIKRHNQSSYIYFKKYIKSFFNTFSCKSFISSSASLSSKIQLLSLGTETKAPVFSFKTFG